MTVKFEDLYLEKLYRGEQVKGKPRFSEEVVRRFKKTVFLITQSQDTLELSRYVFLHFEALKGNKTGLFSVRINYHYRLEFRITKQEVEIVHVVELSNHYE
jgi:toxin HigB-1